MSTQTNELKPVEFGRWIWRQLTSMRTALMLLLLLAVAAVPGSFIPQRSVDFRAVDAYFINNPKLAPVLDKMGMFNVFSTPWFSAIYILLMISLIGCILPRISVYAKAVRARPPKAPKNLLRLPASGAFETDATPDQVMNAGRALLKRARIDVVADQAADADVAELRAEKGYLREFGNLVFHTSIVFVLIGVAIGALWGYRGAVIVTEGDGFSNALSNFDEFGSGALFDPETLAPFTMKLDQLEAQFHVTGPQRGSPKLFRADGTIAEGFAGETAPFAIEVNKPLEIDGAGIFLVGQGYAPVIRITDPSGEVVFDAAVPFLPVDSSYTSTGVVKVPDSSGEQMGFQGFFLPSAYIADPDQPSISIFPGALNPRIGMNLWVGDLGLDDGNAQSVYTLNTSKLTQVKDGDKNFRIDLGPGETAKLPNGGTFEFVELRKFGRFQIADTPMMWLPLVAVCLAIVGLMASLLVRPRRTWIRARREGSRTVVEVAALDRVPRDDLPANLDGFLEELRQELNNEDTRNL